jgi:Pyruvate/2-oxoacid:ferredoxin oxidoreductase delta subunit
MKPVINKRKCSATEEWCNAIPACPNGAIYHVLDASEPLGGKIMIDDAKCDGCGVCVEECCGYAIEMV